MMITHVSRWLAGVAVVGLGCSRGAPFSFGDSLDPLGGSNAAATPGVVTPGGVAPDAPVCVGDRCCNRACGGCEACGDAGICEPVPECAYALCDAGVCQPARAPLGTACEAGTQCESGHCVDGVCCETECDGVCQACSDRGSCNVFPKLDDVCPAVTCAESTACAAVAAPPLGTCAAFGRCAAPADCRVTVQGAGVRCADGLLCDGAGGCSLAESDVVVEPTQVCPAPGGGPTEVIVPLDDPINTTDDGPLCWIVSPDVANTNVVMAGGTLVSGAEPGSIVVTAHVFGSVGNHRSAKTQVFDASGAILPGCVAIDNLRDGSPYTELTFTGPLCQGAAFARVTAHAGTSGDL